MIVPDPRDRFVEKETFAEILACLTPIELLAAALRLEGLSDAKIGALLGMSRQGVRKRLRRAQARIIHTRPDLAPALLGRHRPTNKPKSGQAPPPENGWLRKTGMRGE